MLIKKKCRKAKKKKNVQLSFFLKHRKFPKKSIHQKQVHIWMATKTQKIQKNKRLLKKSACYKMKSYIMPYVRTIEKGKVKLNMLKWAKLFVKYIYIIRLFMKSFAHFNILSFTCPFYIVRDEKYLQFHCCECS